MTAGAPPHVVEAVIAALAEFGPVTVVERDTTRENIHFTLLPQCGDHEPAQSYHQQRDVEADDRPGREHRCPRLRIRTGRVDCAVTGRR
ncbi:MAG: hypothetical protein ACRDSR_06705 [Pseudonocardiaceae bacterium]